MNNNILYEIKGLRRRYGQGFVLDIPYLKIERDKSYGIVGPNGSGKSTLLRILAFIDRQDEGTVWFNQNIPSGDGSKSKSGRIKGAGVTMLLQEPYLLKRSVYENIAYGLRVQGIRQNIREKVNKSLSMVGLDHSIFSHRKWSELSGGEAQRIALAARLVLEPAVLILDEPTASVDRVSAQIIKDTIKKVRKEQMTTLINDYNKQLNDIATKFNDPEFVDSLSPEAEQEMKAKFQTLNEELAQYHNQSSQVMQQANMQLIQTMNAHVQAASEQIAKKKNIPMVVNKEACFFYNPSFDITQSVIEEMDKTFDEQNAAPAAA